MRSLGATMTEWPLVALEDICDNVQYGVTASASADFSAGPKLLRITDIVPPLIDWDSVPNCELSPEQAANFELKPGDIVVARTGATVGYAKLLKDPPAESVFASYLVRFQVGRADANFVGQVVQSDAYKEFVAGNAGGAAQPNANAKVLGSYRFALPDLTTQRRIAAILGAFDELIEINERRIEILNALAESLYRNWFVQCRFPGHHEVAFRDSEAGSIPVGWKVRPFSDLAEYQNGFAFKPAHRKETGLPIIKIKELKQGVTTATPRCRETEIDRKFIVEPGDLLFSWSADLGVYLWPGERGALNQHLFRVQASDPGMQYFVFHALRDALPEFTARAQGTTMRHIKRSALSEVKVPVPTPDLVTAFTGCVEPVHLHALTLRHQNA